MNTVSIWTSVDDAEQLAVILLRAEVDFSVEMVKTTDEQGFLFTVSERNEDDE